MQITDDDIIELAKGTINTLDLSWCNKITNVDVLENVSKLTLPY